MFDRTDDYEEKIKPILKELNRMCVICGIPYFAAFCVKDMDGKTSYRNVLYSASKRADVWTVIQLYGYGLLEEAFLYVYLYP